MMLPARSTAACLLPMLFALWAPLAIGADPQPAADVIIRGGTIYDGSGSPPIVGDVAIRGDRIVAVGDIGALAGAREVNAQGMAVAPGFVNMLSWATTSLLTDGRSQSDIRQGVTLEVFGEGWSMGPLNPRMKKDMLEGQGDLKFDVPWTTLGEYLQHMEHKGVSCNVASFLGATTVRIHVLGYENRAPTPTELNQMRALVDQAMQEGALGIGSSLIYAPAFYAKTDELIELCKIAAPYGGMYISHMRSEGNQVFEAIAELVRIAREARIPAEIYHLKTAGEANWPKRQKMIEMIEQARAEGLKITADMYTYTAGSTGLNGTMPPWVQEGGLHKWIERLRDPKIRAKVIAEMKVDNNEWENLLCSSGSPDRVLLVGFKNPDLKHLTGRTLGEVAKQRGTSPEETAINLVIEDGSRVDTVYFMMNEDHVRQNVTLPWLSFCSDSGSIAPEGAFLLSSPHPRTYGTFARLLGRYVRDEQLIPLEEAVRKLTSLPCENLGIRERGRLKEGNFADVVIFDPARIQDHATFEKPHQYSTGVAHVWVNGKQVLADGEHTGATPGRAVWGPGRGKKIALPAARATGKVGTNCDAIATVAAGR